MADGSDMHPNEFVTVNVYVPVARPEMVVLVELPVIAPGLIIQSPAGNPVRVTLPVAVVQVG